MLELSQVCDASHTVEAVTGWKTTTTCFIDPT
jgi:hypothetical protein